MRLPEDRTARAIIRDEALRLFAERGPSAVTVRDVAAEADVSPALVIRHYGSKDGLRQAVDEYVVAVLGNVLAELAHAERGPFDEASLASLVDGVVAKLPPGSAVPGYLARLLVEGGETGSGLFRQLHTMSMGVLGALAASGHALSGDDPPVRAAFLLVNDLGVLILRQRIVEVLGFDPLSAAGMTRWGAQVQSVYRQGLSPPGLSPSGRTRREGTARQQTRKQKGRT